MRESLALAAPEILVKEGGEFPAHFLAIPGLRKRTGAATGRRFEEGANGVYESDY
jgi:hypothetical protein